MTLESLLTEDFVRKVAGSTYYARGLSYYKQGLVSQLTSTSTTIKAEVEGSEYYDVQISCRRNDLSCRCSCPLGDNQEVCKHLVAVALTWLRDGPRETESPEQSNQNADLRKYLNGIDKSALVEMVMEQAIENDRFGENLRLAMVESSSIFDVSVYKQELKETLGSKRHISYYQMVGHERAISAVVSKIERLIQTPHVVHVIDLCEYGLKLYEGAIGRVDDSDGGMAPIKARLESAHLEACLKAKPDPAKLAKMLFETEMKSDWDVFHGALPFYAEILGESGLAQFRKLAEAEWAKIPFLAVGDLEIKFESKRFRITQIMVSLAELTGDVENIAEVHTRDLSSTYQFLTIARTYRDAGNLEKAIHWAELGLQSFDGSRDSRLADYLVQIYEDADRWDEAMALIWKEYLKFPCLTGYKNLHRVAMKADIWPSWRERALPVIQSHFSSNMLGPGVRSDLIRLYLWEGNLDLAWREAKARPCGSDLLLELAQLREKDHPADAIHVYMTFVEPLIEKKNNHSYTEALSYLTRIGVLKVRMGLMADFRAYLDSLREKHPTKKSFLKMLDGSGLGR